MKMRSPGHSTRRDWVEVLAGLAVREPSISSFVKPMSSTAVCGRRKMPNMSSSVASAGNPVPVGAPLGRTG